MKKRLRKKKHKGEFAIFGRQFIVRRKRKEDFSSFLDWFVTDVVERTGCFCGGGGKEDKLDVVVELGRRDQNPDKRKDEILRALHENPEVELVLVGEEFDVWYGSCDDIKE